MRKLSKLHKLITMAIIGLAVSAGSVSSSRAKGLLDGSEIDVSSDIAFYSKYIWRGFELDSDPVIQPGVYVSGYGLTLSVWGSFDIDDDDALNSDEIDYVIDYTKEFEKINLYAGHTYYDFPAGDAASKEFYVGAGLDVLLSPSLTWYHDYADEDSGGGDGDYIVLDGSYSYPLGEKGVSFDLAGHVGYNSELFIEGEGIDTGVSASLVLPLSDNCYFSPVIAYSAPFGDLEDEDDGNQSDEFYGGCVLAFSM